MIFPFFCVPCLLDTPAKIVFFYSSYLKQLLISRLVPRAVSCSVAAFLKEADGLQRGTTVPITLHNSRLDELAAVIRLLLAAEPVVAISRKRGWWLVDAAA